MARPTKFNKSTADKLIEFISSGLTIKNSCRGCNISEDSFNRWRKKYPDFDRAIANTSNLQWQNAESPAKYGCRAYKRNQKPTKATFHIAPIPKAISPSKPTKINKIMGLPISFASPDKWIKTEPHFNINSNKIEWIDKDLILHSCSPAKFRANGTNNKRNC